MLNFGIRYVPMYIHRILLYVLKIFSTYVLKVCDILTFENCTKK